MNYNLLIGEQQHGPYEEKQILDMLLQGNITEQTLFCPEGGTDEWKPVTTIAGLLDLLASKPSVEWTGCTCNVCSGKLEFDPANTGETIQCPHCGVDTLLFIPQVRAPVSRPVETQEAQPIEQPKAIIVTTGNEISGRSIKSYVGIARGLVVRSPNIVQGLFGGLNQIVGGNIQAYADVCEESRREAFSRMLEQAENMNADAIIAMRYDATEFAPGITEVLAYGTAVTLFPPCKI